MVTTTDFMKTILHTCHIWLCH